MNWGQLIGVKTPSQIVTAAKDKLSEMGSALLTSTNWGTWYDFLKVIGWLVKLIFDKLVEIAPQLFISSCTELLWAKQHAGDHGVEYLEACKTRYYLTFTRSDTSATANVNADNFARTGQDASGKSYRFKTLESLQAAIGEDTLDVPVEAEFAGADYNVSQESIVEFDSAFTGWDSVTNLDRAVDNFETLDTVGRDDESLESLQSRIISKLSEGGVLADDNYYMALVREVLTNALVTVVRNARGPGSINLVCTDELGEALSTSVLALVQSHVNIALPITDSVLVVSYTPQSIDQAITIYVKSGLATATREAIEELATVAAIDMFKLGSTGVRPFAVGEDVRRDRERFEITKAIEPDYPATVLSFAFSPDEDVTVADTSKAVAGTLSITISEVSEL